MSLFLFLEHTGSVLSSVYRKKTRKLWLAAPLSLIWAIWKERNIIVFEDATFSYNRLKLSFITALNSWFFEGRKFFLCPFFFVQALSPPVYFRAGSWAPCPFSIKIYYCCFAYQKKSLFLLHMYILLRIKVVISIPQNYYFLFFIFQFFEVIFEILFTFIETMSFISSLTTSIRLSPIHSL